MAWVRLHDDALSSPKILAISDRAFRLWVWGLTYAQRHLTDGFIPYAALPPKIKSGVPELMKPGGPASSLGPLWHVADGGFTIHDYLQWNDSKGVITKKRGEAKDRMAGVRDRRAAEDRRVADVVHANVRERTSSGEVLRGVSVSTSASLDREEGSGEKPGGDWQGAWHVEAFMAAFRDGWKALYGYECSLIVKPLQYSDLTRQMAAIHETQMRAALAAYFATDDPYVAKAKHPLPLFLRDPLRFLATPKAATAADDKACPRCGTVPRCRSFKECTDRAIVAARPSAS